MMMPRHLFALGLVAFVGIATPAAARAPRGRPISGIVQKSKTSAQEVEIVRTDSSEPLSFVWTDRTIFVANRQLVNAAILEPGARIEVIYHRPFFGRPFVTRVMLLSAPGAHH